MTTLLRRLVKSYNLSPEDAIYSEDMLKQEFRADNQGFPDFNDWLKQRLPDLKQLEEWACPNCGDDGLAVCDACHSSFEPGLIGQWLEI